MARPAVIAGAGGHARSVLWAARSAGELEIVACTDPHVTGELDGVPIVGSDERLAELAAARPGEAGAICDAPSPPAPAGEVSRSRQTSSDTAGAPPAATARDGEVSRSRQARPDTAGAPAREAAPGAPSPTAPGTPSPTALGAPLPAGITAAVIGVGGSRDNALRAAVYERLVHLGFELPPVVHSRAIVAETATLGPGTVVLAGAVVGAGARIGANVIVNTGAVVDHDCVLEDHVHVASGATLGGDVHVAHGAHVGLGASIIQGRRVGELAIVGAGAVVIRDVPQGTTVKGVPARA